LKAEGLLRRRSNQESCAAGGGSHLGKTDPTLGSRKLPVPSVPILRRTFWHKCFRGCETMFRAGLWNAAA